MPQRHLIRESANQIPCLSHRGKQQCHSQDPQSVAIRSEYERRNASSDEEYRSDIAVHEAFPKRPAGRNDSMAMNSRNRTRFCSCIGKTKVESDWITPTSV